MGIECFLEGGEEKYMLKCDKCGAFYGWSRPSVEKLKILAEESHGWSVVLNVSKPHGALCPKCVNNKEAGHGNR